MKSVEEKSAVSPAVPKRSAGWDALARLFGLSAPPPDADVPLPESPKESAASRSAAESRPASSSPPSAPPSAKTLATPAASKPVTDDLTDLGWGTPRSSKERPGREVSGREASAKEPTAKDASFRDAPVRESSAGREGGQRPARDTGSRESHDKGRRHDRDAGVRETGSRDIASRERDSESREGGRREREAAPSRERSTRDPAVWDIAGRGDQAREDVESSVTPTPRGEATREEGGRQGRRGRDGRRDRRQPGERQQSDRQQSDRQQSDRQQSDRQQSDRQQSDRQQSDRPQGERGAGRRDPRDVEARESEGRGGDRRGNGRSEGRFAESKRDDLSEYDHRFVENDDSDIEDLEDISFTPPRGKEKPRGVEETWVSEVEPGFEEVAEEGGQPERRGRRRRGRRRGGKGPGDAIENRGTRPEATPERSKRESFGRTSEDDGDRDFPEPLESDLDVTEAPAGEESSGERRGRRRRRRGGGRRQEPVTASAEDLDNAELDLSEGYNLPGLLADEIESSDEEERGHAQIPTWEESVGVLVRLNIDARHRPDSGKGGQRHGGQHGGGHGGNSGQGRGRGGNRPPNKR